MSAKVLSDFHDEALLLSCWPENDCAAVERFLTVACLKLGSKVDLNVAVALGIELFSVPEVIFVDASLNARHRKVMVTAVVEGGLGDISLVGDCMITRTNGLQVKDLLLLC